MFRMTLFVLLLLSSSSLGLFLHDSQLDVFSFASFEELMSVQEDQIWSWWSHVGLVVVLTSMNPALLISLRMREPVSLVE